jgi:Zinc-finger associated domain (zf-AD)
MLKYKLCRICMKQTKANTTFVKIFESTAIGDLVANILIDFANVNVTQNDDLPHIICNTCLDQLIKCREFQKLVIQNDSTLANLAEKSPDEIHKSIAEPLIRIEKLKKCEESTIVQLDMTEDFHTENIDGAISIESSSSSEDEDDFPIEQDMPEKPVEAHQPRFMCCCCPLQFGEEHEMIKHLKTEHAAIRSRLNIAPVDKDPDLVKQCEMCFKYFIGRIKLEEHQARFSQAKCEQCVECGEFYQKKG